VDDSLFDIADFWAVEKDRSDIEDAHHLVDRYRTVDHSEVSTTASGRVSKYDTQPARGRKSDAFPKTASLDGSKANLAWPTGVILVVEHCVIEMGELSLDGDPRIPSRSGFPVVEFDGRVTWDR
jgi:hypothetical protein